MLAKRQALEHKENTVGTLIGTIFGVRNLTLRCRSRMSGWSLLR